MVIFAGHYHFTISVRLARDWKNNNSRFPWRTFKITSSTHFDAHSMTLFLSQKRDAFISHVEKRKNVRARALAFRTKALQWFLRYSSYVLASKNFQENKTLLVFSCVKNYCWKLPRSQFHKRAQVRRQSEALLLCRATRSCKHGG